MRSVITGAKRATPSSVAFSTSHSSRLRLMGPPALAPKTLMSNAGRATPLRLLKKEFAAVTVLR